MTAILPARKDNGGARPVVPAAAPCSGAGDAFLDLVQRLGLLSSKSAAGFLREHHDAPGVFLSGEAMGQALVAAGLLTDYQFERLLAGSTHGLVLGNYQVLRRIGAGGMGIVFEAKHVWMKRRAAIKVLPVDDDCPQSLLDRFYQEMEVLAKLDHPNIVRAFDAGQVPAAQGMPALLYLAMELIDGCDLEQYAARNWPIPIGLACAWICQAAAGLQAAHEGGLVHRDVKPSNLLLTRRGHIKLVDFGLVRQFSKRLTDPRDLLGTLEFMAPEQSHDPTSVSTHADIFALGASLFWLLTGEGPYQQGTSLNDSLRILKSARPRRLRTLRPDAPRELEAALARLLHPDPFERPAFPQMAARALSPFADPSLPANFLNSFPERAA